MLTELLTIIVIVCLGIFAVWLFLKVVKMAFKMACIAVLILLFYYLVQFFRGLFGG